MDNTDTLNMDDRMESSARTFARDHMPENPIPKKPVPEARAPETQIPETQVITRPALKRSIDDHLGKDRSSENRGRGQENNSDRSSRYQSGERQSERKTTRYYCAHCDNYYDRTDSVKRRKLSGTAKTAIGLGGVFTAVYLSGRKIWHYFYPPKFKKYVALGVMLTTVAAVKNCGSVNREIGELYHDAKYAIIHRVDNREKIKELEQKIKELSRNSSAYMSPAYKLPEMKNKNAD